MNLLPPKTINCSAKYIKLNEIENKVFLDALSKSNARWDGKQEIFLYGLMFKQMKARLKSTNLQLMMKFMFVFDGISCLLILSCFSELFIMCLLRTFFKFVMSCRENCDPAIFLSLSS